MTALAIVEFRVERGEKKKNARDDVANALGVAVSTIRTWERRLDKLEVARRLSFARNAASYEGDARYGHEALQKLAQAYGHEALPHPYGHEALEKLAQAYWASLRRRQARRRKAPLKR